MFVFYNARSNFDSRAVDVEIGTQNTPFYRISKRRSFHSLLTNVELSIYFIDYG